MSEINTGGPAFPNDYHTGSLRQLNQGMTLRDYFAAEAMKVWFPVWERDKDFDLPSRAYKLADAMIAARGDQ